MKGKDEKRKGRMGAVLLLPLLISFPFISFSFSIGVEKENMIMNDILCMYLTYHAYDR